MNLKEILVKIVESKEEMILNDGNKDWDADSLLENLSERRLKTNAHLQSGMYIAEINSGGYLGQVLYKIKAHA